MELFLYAHGKTEAQQGNIWAGEDRGRREVRSGDREKEREGCNGLSKASPGRERTMFLVPRPGSCLVHTAARVLGYYKGSLGITGGSRRGKRGREVGPRLAGVPGGHRTRGTGAVCSRQQLKPLQKMGKRKCDLR